MTIEEQVNKYEFTAEQVLKMVGLDPNKYIAEKDFSTSAVKRLKNANKNCQFYEWVIYHKVNGKKGSKVKIQNMPQVVNARGYNKYAAGTENGIVIYKPVELGKKINVKPTERKFSSDSSSDNSSFDSSTNFDSSMGSFETGGTIYEVSGFSGNDEEIVKRLMFIKLQLLKESYEFAGVLL